MKMELAAALSCQKPIPDHWNWYWNTVGQVDPELGPPELELDPVLLPDRRPMK